MRGHSIQFVKPLKMEIIENRNKWRLTSPWLSPWHHDRLAGCSSHWWTQTTRSHWGTAHPRPGCSFWVGPARWWTTPQCPQCISIGSPDFIWILLFPTQNNLVVAHSDWPILADPKKRSWALDPVLADKVIDAHVRDQSQSNLYIFTSPKIHLKTLIWTSSLEHSAVYSLEAT